MKLRVAIFVFLILKVSLSTAFCQVKCGAEESCCSQTADVPCSEDKASLPDQPEDTSSEDSEDCQCPACHAHIVINGDLDTQTEISELTEALHHWSDSMLESFSPGVFHPPCPLLT